jgi:hypothetical protein
MPTTYAIPDGRVAMAATLYTGTNATQVINNAVNGVSFQPDFTWVKVRSTTYSNTLVNSVMGLGSALFSDTTQAVIATTEYTSYNSNGFTLGASGSTASNVSGASYVAWQWKAGGTAVSNTAGSITSSVSANTTAGFSVVTYTGTGANATVGHGLGVAPSMVIVKKRSAVGNWRVQHASLGYQYYGNLNDTGFFSLDTTLWNSAPTSIVFGLGTNDTNTSTATYVAYCFAPVAGYSAFGKYTGNGSADGPFVYTGFRPRFVLIKSSSAVNSWAMYDTSRSIFNTSTARLFANTSAAETTGLQIDILSNGFKLREGGGQGNDSSQTYIYYAVAENPFAYSNAR